MNALRSWRRGLGVAILGAVGLGLSGGAAATAGYCVAPTPLTTDGLALTDVVFTIGTTDYSPVDCYGLVNTGSSDLSTNLTYVNNLRWEDFVNGVKDDVGGGTNSVTVDSIQYTLTAGADTGSTTNMVSHWTLSWSDTNGATPPNLPLSVDFAVQWNGGNNDAFYLLQNVLLPVTPTSGSGSINIVAMNNPGNADLGSSHINLYFTNTRPAQPDEPPPTVPEPGTVFLIGSALLGLALAQRRRSRA